MELEKVNEKKWNETLSEAEFAGTIYQSTYWANYLKETFGDRPIYLTALDKKGDIEGLLLAMESCYANHTSLTMLGSAGRFFGKLYKSVSPVLHKVLPYIYWENGPIVLPRSEQNAAQREAVYQRLVEGIVEEGARRSCYEIRQARPPFYVDQNATYVSLGFQESRMGTLIVNLNQPIDVIWKNIQRETRRLIEKSLAKGLETKRVEKLADLEKFYNVYVEKSKRSGTKTFPFSYYANMWRFLSPDKKIVFFTLSLEDKPLGILTFLTHNRMMHLFSADDSDYARQTKIQATRILMWDAMKWAREMGIHFFDLGGVELHKMNAGSIKASNIYAFKSMWGGQLVEFHDYRRGFQERRLSRRVRLSLNHFMTG